MYDESYFYFFDNSELFIKFVEFIFREDSEGLVALWFSLLFDNLI